MAHFELYETYDALGLAELVRTKEVSALELLETAIARVERFNPTLNAVVMPMYEEARKLIGKGLPDGPLKGVPFLLKDLGVFYQGVSTTSGCQFLSQAIADHTSTLVQRYLQAGLVVFGKTNTPEFGLTVTTEPRFYGPCRNPWNIEYTCGGSSGGAAVAVAAGMVPVAHASDGGGSIRIPASCCGLFGLKPTRGRIPAGPSVGEKWNGMTADHAITRSVRDSAALLDVSAGPALGDPYFAPPATRSFLDEVGQPPGKLRIAFGTQPPSGAIIDAQCAKAVQSTAQLCSELGHIVEEAMPVIDFEPFQKAFVVIVDANMAAILDAAEKDIGRAVTAKDVEHITWRSALSGKEISAIDYIEAVQVIHQTGRKVAQFFETYDVLLTPVLAKPPVPLGYLNTQSEDVKGYLTNLSTFFGFTNLFNATGQPAMSVPLHWTDDNLPIGLQFAARYGQDAVLFRLAAQLEQARPWKDRRPAVSQG